MKKNEFPTVDKLVKNSINDVLDNPREVSAEEQKCNHLNCPRQFDKVEEDCDINGCLYRTTGITLSALISRQMAIEFIKDHSYPVRYDETSIERGMTLTGIEQALNEVPTIQSQQKTGHWFDVGSLSCRCSECGCKNNKESNYCPECGAYMKGDNNNDQTTSN